MYNSFGELLTSIHKELWNLSQPLYWKLGCATPSGKEVLPANSPLWEKLSCLRFHTLPLRTLHSITNQCFDIKPWPLTLTLKNSEGPSQFQSLTQSCLRLLWECATTYLLPLFNLVPFPAPTGEFPGQQSCQSQLYGETELKYLLIHQFQIENK